MSRPIRRVKNVTELPILAGPSRLGPRPKWNVTAPQPILSHNPRQCKKYPDPVNRSCLASRSFATHASHPPNVSTIPSISPENTFDIVIIGGGNAGLALTCALLSKPTIRSTSRILLLEGGSLDRVRSWTRQAEWENRVSSLTAENVSWLDSIGVWKYVEDSRSCPVNEMIVWANPNPSSTPTLHFPPLGHPMARMTENINLQRALLRRIEAAGKGVVEIREDTRVREIQSGEGDQWVGLRVDENDWVRGAAVVGADGPNSLIRRYSNIDSYGFPYPTHAVVATLHHQSPSFYPNHTAFQRFLPTGPLAFLPLSPTVSTMVWSTRPDLAAAYKKLAPEALTAVVNAGFTVQEDVLAHLDERIKAEPLSAEAITSFLASNTPESPFSSDPPALPPTIMSIPPRSIASFPLRLSHAETYLGDRTVLVGDAAHTIHPLAGQGLNMGLADVRCLANVWEITRRTGGDFGARTGLLDYPRERYPANQLMLSTTDTLHHFFGSRLAPVNSLRGTGLDILNQIGPIKKLLMGGAGASEGPVLSERARSEDGHKKGFEGRGRGWPMAAASGLEGWLGFKHVLGIAAGLAGEAAKNGLRRAAEVLEKR